METHREVETHLVCANVLLLLYDRFPKGHSSPHNTSAPFSRKITVIPISRDPWNPLQLQIHLQPPEGGPAPWQVLKTLPPEPGQMFSQGWT